MSFTMILVYVFMACWFRFFVVLGAGCFMILNAGIVDFAYGYVGLWVVIIFVTFVTLLFWTCCFRIKLWVLYVGIYFTFMFAKCWGVGIIHYLCCWVVTMLGFLLLDCFDILGLPLIEFGFIVGQLDFDCFFV